MIGWDTRMNALVLSRGLALKAKMLRPFYWQSPRGGPGNPCRSIHWVMCWKRTFREGWGADGGRSMWAHLELVGRREREVADGAAPRPQPDCPTVQA